MDGEIVSYIKIHLQCKLELIHRGLVLVCLTLVEHLQELIMEDYTHGVEMYTENWDTEIQSIDHRRYRLDQILTGHRLYAFRIM